MNARQKAKKFKTLYERMLPMKANFNAQICTASPIKTYSVHHTVPEGATISKYDVERILANKLADVIIYEMDVIENEYGFYKYYRAEIKVVSK